jgi:hypothetical protein
MGQFALLDFALSETKRKIDQVCLFNYYPSKITYIPTPLNFAIDIQLPASVFTAGFRFAKQVAMTLYTSTIGL